MYLLPLGDEVGVGISLLQQVLVQLLGDRLTLVVQLVNISRPLVVKSENRPQCLDLSLSFMGIVLGYWGIDMEERRSRVSVI
jgi:hypothetical protein